MRKTLWISIAAALMLATAGCRKEPAGEAQTQQQVEEAQKRVEQAEQEAAEARRQLEEAQQKAAQAEQQRQLEEAQKRLERAQRQASEARRQLQEAQKTAQAAPQQPTAPPSPAASSVAPQPPAPKPITVPAGTQVVVRTTTAISTKDMKTGEHFAATLQQPLVVDGVTLAPKGAEVEGVVVESDPGGRVKGVAQIAVALHSIHTSAGKVEIQTGAYVTQARSSVKKDVTRGAIMTGVGAAIGAIAGGGKGAAVGAGVGAGAGTATAVATRGEAATIPAESVLTFALKAPVTVTVK